MTMIIPNHPRPLNPRKEIPYSLQTRIKARRFSVQPLIIPNTTLFHNLFLSPLLSLVSNQASITIMGVLENVEQDRKDFEVMDRRLAEYVNAAAYYDPMAAGQPAFNGHNNGPRVVHDHRMSTFL